MTARVYELEERDPAEADRLRKHRRGLFDLQERLSPDNPDAIENVIAPVPSQ